MSRSLRPRTRDGWRTHSRFRFDQSTLAMHMHLSYASFGSLHAPRLGEAAQEARVQRRIKLKGVGDLRQRRARELGLRPQKSALPRRDGGERIRIQRRQLTEMAALEPEVLKIHSQHGDAVRAEGMNVTIADP